MQLKGFTVLSISILFIVAFFRVSSAIQPLPGEWEATGTGEFHGGFSPYNAILSFSFVVSDDRLSLTTNGHIELTSINANTGGWGGTAFIPYEGKSVEMEISDGSISYIDNRLTLEGRFTSETTAEGTWKADIYFWWPSDADGTWAASYTEPIRIRGDVNGDGNVKSNDAILALRISVGLLEPTEHQKWTADMNGDGAIKSNDAILILRKAAGLDNSDKQ